MVLHFYTFKLKAEKKKVLSLYTYNVQYNIMDVGTERGKLLARWAHNFLAVITYAYSAHDVLSNLYFLRPYTIFI